jgi:hypothetical protein
MLVLCKKLIIALVFEKDANFSAEKLAKIVIVTSIPVVERKHVITRVARLLFVQHTKTGKIHQNGKNIPNNHKNTK